MFEDFVAAQHVDMYNSLMRLKDTMPTDYLDPEVMSFGVRVKTTEHGWVVLVRTLVNWRLLDCRNDPFRGVPTEFSGWTRGWCYAEPNSFVSGLLAAVTWSGRPDTEPSGWIKSIPDGRRHSEPKDGITQE